MVTSPCRGLTARNNKLFQFYDLLVVGLCPPPKGSEAFHSLLVTSDATKRAKALMIYDYLIIHNFGKKQSPFALQGLFSVLPRIMQDIL